MNKLWIITSLLVLVVGCNENATREYVYTGEAIGTSYQVKYFHNEEIEMERGLDSIFRVLNKSLSTYQDDSDISLINAGDTAVVIDHHFKEVFQYSGQIHRESKGYFDPTVGNLVNAYGFGPGTRQEELQQAQIDSLLQFVGFGKLYLNPNNTIQKDHPEIFLDFNAIAKGYVVDVIALYMDRNGVKNYLLEVGGELVAKGVNVEKGHPWVVAIDDPLQATEERTFQAVLELRDRAMATSGNYRKFRIDPVTGRRFVHTINPLTGQSQKSNLLSASVLAENCTLADGYATAFMALGLEKSLEMLEDLQNVDVYFIYAEKEEGAIQIYTTAGFEEALVKD